MKALELKVPPVAQFLLMVTGMWLIARYVPSLAIDIPARIVLAVVVAVLGGAVAAPAVKVFRSAGTTVDPTDPGRASQLVVASVYRFSRNPMYLGLLCLLIAWAIWLSHWLAFACLPVFVLYMNRFQIRPEERAMDAQFGDDYREYMKSVRRWI
jgi:protein-S-isoprenylcysteine O-methyltransferase Ste14